MAVKYQSAHRWPRAIKFNPHHLVLWSFLGLSQWIYVRDDMSKGLKIMSLGVINHGMSLSVLYMTLTCRWIFYFWYIFSQDLDFQPHMSILYSIVWGERCVFVLLIWVSGIFPSLFKLSFHNLAHWDKAYSTERDIPWLITPRDIIFNPLDISSRT